MELPLCPNYREKSCERSEQRLERETETHWSFFCKCCESTWVVSKPNTREKARFDLDAKKVRHLTAYERRSRRSYSFGAR